MEDLMPLIRQVSLFSGIGDEALDTLLKCCGAEGLSYREGEEIILQEGSADKVLILLAGTAEIVRETIWGEKEPIGLLLAGEVFAPTVLDSGSKKEGTGGLCLTAKASCPCAALILDYGRMLTFCPLACGFHSQLIYNLLGSLWGKNLQLERRLEHVCRRSTREKLLSYLSDQARIHQSLEFDIPLNRQELADYLCVDRSAMSSELGKMRDEGILEFRREHFVMRGEVL